jgi:WD40 repeat protein
LQAVSPWRLQFSPDGEKLGVVYEDGSTVIFEPTGTNLPISLRGQARVSTDVQSPLVFSADGRWAGLVKNVGIASVYDLAAGGKLITNFFLMDLRSMSFHPQKTWLALGGYRQTKVIDWSEGQLIRAFTNESSISAVTFRPDGKQLAAAAGNVGVSLWDVETGEPKQLNVPTGTFHELHYSPAGTYVSVAMGEGVSSIWDAQTGRLVHKMAGARVSRFAADEEHVGIERPREGLAIRQFSPREALRVYRSNPEHLGQRRRFWGVDISEDGRWLAAVDDINLTIWETASGRIVATKPGLRRLSVFWLRGQQAWLTSG